LHFHECWMCYITFYFIFVNSFCSILLKKSMFDKFNVLCIIEGLKHILFLNIDMFTFVEIYTCDLRWKIIIKKIDLITYCLKIHGNTCELNFWNWHFNPIMSRIQNMEAMFQTWKNIIFKKDLHLGPTSSFYCECNQK
jgi:hypothetical protein